MSDSGAVVPATAWTDVEKAHERALLVDWARDAQHNPKNFGEFATAGAIVMREYFGENFSGMVQGRAANGQIVTVALESVTSDMLRIQPVDSVKAAALAEASLAEDAQNPTPEQLAEIATDDPGVLVNITEFVQKALESGVEYQQCEMCESRDRSVGYVVDPYIEEVREETVYRWLCSECLQTRRDDI